MKNLTKLLESKKTVFITEDWVKIFWNNNLNYIRLIFHRLKNSWGLKEAKKWVWVLTKHNSWKLSNSLLNHSYISLETILYKHNFIFQTYIDTITAVSKRKLEIEFEDKSYQYKRFINRIVDNSIGIEDEDIDWEIVRVASKERAICDWIHMTWKIYFDNITRKMISLKKMDEIKHIYPNKTVLKINKFINDIE